MAEKTTSTSYELSTFLPAPVQYPSPMTMERKPPASLAQPTLPTPPKTRRSDMTLVKKLKSVYKNTHVTPNESEHSDADDENEDEEEGEEDEEEDEDISVTPAKPIVTKKTRIHVSLVFEKKIDKTGKSRLKANFAITPRCIAMALGMPELTKSMKWTSKTRNVVPIHASGVRDLLRPIYICLKKNKNRIPQWNTIYSVDKQKHYMAIISTDSIGASLSNPISSNDKTNETMTDIPSMDIECMRIVATTDCKDITNEVLLPFQLPVLADVCVELEVEIC